MTTSAVILFAMIVAGISLLVWRNFVMKKNAPESDGKQADAYRCLVIEPSEPACEAARALLAWRFLPDEAPQLPLAQCSQPVCHCRYRQQSDRRQDYRRNPYGQGVCMPPRADGDDRRSRNDRRRMDQ